MEWAWESGKKGKIKYAGGGWAINLFLRLLNLKGTSLAASNKMEQNMSNPAVGRI